MTELLLLKIHLQKDWKDCFNKDALSILTDCKLEPSLISAKVEKTFNLRGKVISA